LCVVLAVGCRQDGGRATSAEPDDRPNIVLVTFESLRADHVGCYGYERDTTPAIDALSKEGITFDNAYSVTSWTLASHATIFTGLYPTAHKVVAHNHMLDDSYTTLAELLGQAGYQTAGFVSGPFLRTTHNLNQGFEIYDDSIANPKGNQAAHGDVTNPRMEKLVSDFLSGQRDKARPFFLFLYLWDPHYDYIPPEPYDKKFVPADAEAVEVRGYEERGIVTEDINRNQLAYVVSQYDGEVLWTDALLGRLWKQLRDLGLWENTAVVLTADHGESFFEHGKKGHKNNLYVEELHVPLVVKLPGPPAAARDTRIVNLIDLFPTVLDIADTAANQPHQGRSLLAPPPESAKPTYFELQEMWFSVNRVTRQVRAQGNMWYAVRLGDYKLVNVQNKDIWELYDLASDPAELEPLGAEHNDKRDALRKLLETHNANMRQLASDWGQAQPARLSPEDLRRLEALGYVRRVPASQQSDEK
jgi:arylsulfatase A-like enzyme